MVGVSYEGNRSAMVSSGGSARGGAMSYIRQDGGCGRQSCTDDGSM